MPAKSSMTFFGSTHCTPGLSSGGDQARKLFPKWWPMATGLSDIARHIANAIPDNCWLGLLYELRAAMFLTKPE